jgi:tetratricopeptide (TPR) repeat protein
VEEDENSFPEIAERIDEILHKPRGQGVQELDTLLDELDAAVKAQPSAALLCAIGYGLYVHPERVSHPEMNEHLKEVLNDALRLDSNFAPAALYLAHYNYDLGEYSLAVELFQQALGACWNDYYRTKIVELLVCCRIHLVGLRGCLGDLSQFVELCGTVDEYDVFPIELFKTVNSAVVSGADVEAVSKAARLLETLVDITNQRTVFEEDIRNLLHIARQRRPEAELE